MLESGGHNNSNKNQLCKKNCGFFGSSTYEGYCSKCYHEKNKSHDSMNLKHNHSEHSPNDVDPTSRVSTYATKEVIEELFCGQTSESLSLNHSEYNCKNTNKILPHGGSSVKNNPKVEIKVTPEIIPIIYNEESSMISMKDDKIEYNDKAQFHKEFMNNDDLSSSKASQVSSSKRLRCQECSKKVGLTGITCRCGGLFCAKHRYTDKHPCSYNYQSVGAESIKKENPTVVAKKLEKI